jgi:3-oxoacyl-[acyl-carrier-protein] synthase III
VTGGPRTLAFDISNGGVGFLNACHMAAELIRAGKHSVAMVVASEVENNLPGGPAAPIGIVETGSAVILDMAPEPGQGFGAFLFKNFPAHIDRLSSFTSMAGGQLVMNVERDQELHELYLDCITETVRELLDAEGLSLDQVQVILPPQVAPGFVGKLAQRLGAQEARCVDVATEDGDLLSSSLPHAMRHALDHGMVSRGDLGLLIAVGSGIQVNCALYRF